MIPIFNNSILSFGVSNIIISLITYSRLRRIQFMGRCGGTSFWWFYTGCLHSARHGFPLLHNIIKHYHIRTGKKQKHIVKAYVLLTAFNFMAYYQDLLAGGTLTFTGACAGTLIPITSSLLVTLSFSPPVPSS